MTDRIALHDYRNSRAILVGTSTYRKLAHVPAARSLHRLHGLLTSDLCGWPADRITVIQNPSRPDDLHKQLIQLFYDVKDVALFYFVGHGLIDDTDELCLGLVESENEPHLRAATSLEFRVVRDAFTRSSAETNILILDCCFAGLANERRNALGPADLVDQAIGVGAYTMAACHAYGTATFDTDSPDPQTHFTKHLVDLIEAGIPGQQAELRLHAIFGHLTDRLASVGHPRPIERNVDSARDFVFAYNAAPVQVQVDIPTALQNMDVRLAKIEASISALTRKADGPVPLGTGSAAPATGMRSDSVAKGDSASRRPASEQTRVAELRATAAELLRVRNGAEFRKVEAQLREVGASARPTAILQTSMGPIVVRLFPDYAPEAVRNFIELAQGTRPWLDPRQREPLRQETRLYDGTLFHRVINGLLIQGGDPIGTGTGGPGYRQENEIHPDLAFDRPYIVAMANSGESSNGSQFFITVSPAPWLTGKQTIFGEVIDNGTVVDRISQVSVDAENRPIEDVMLESVRINGNVTGSY